MGIRTDLALESARRLSLTRDVAGITQCISIDRDTQLEITDISIDTESAAQLIGRPCGEYITVKAVDDSFDSFSPHFDKRAQLIAHKLKLLSGNAAKILVAGLGNRMITPDSIGPLCADKIFATRHIKKYAQEIDSEDFGEISVIQTGVMGQTGMEASEQVKAICDKIKPDAVIAVDALACSELSHLGCTIQLCSTGISPGSGVENARKELSRATLGIPCIAVGVPMVMDLRTAAQSIFSQKAPKGTQGMSVTPRNVDRLAENSAEYIAMAINLAFHKGLTPQELRTLV